MGKYLIIGGSRGIGKAIALGLLEKNHEVTISSTSGEADFHHHNLSVVKWNAENNEEISLDSEHLDGLVYCPGTINLKPFHRITKEEFSNEFLVNALGAAEVLKSMLPALKKASAPSVVLFSTVAVGTGMPFHSSIAMAKGAVEGLTKSLAAEWAPTIRVNCVSPSLTATDLAQKLISSPEKMEASAKRHPLHRIGQPSDLASAVQFLLSSESSWITGQNLHVDGGMSTLKLL